MYCAMMMSEHYEFIAFGKTKQEAKRNILREWRRNPYAVDTTVPLLEEWYGIRVVECKPGCYLF